MPKKKITKITPKGTLISRVVVVKWAQGEKPVLWVDYPVPENGYTPKKGVDYFDGEDGKTPTEEELLSLIIPRIPEPIPWKPGKDIPVGKVKKIVEEVVGTIEFPTIDIWEDQRGQWIMKDGKKMYIKSVSNIWAWMSTWVVDFIALRDTPSSYIGQASKTVKVKADETGLEFVAWGWGWAVDSVNWQTGVVVLDTDDISEWTNKYNVNHTGDATGATALTLATVNSNVGSFTNANITVNAKGLITAASNGSGAGDLLYTTITLTGTQITGMGTTSGISLISAVSGKTICPVSCYAIGVSWTVYTGGTNATWRLNYSATASTTDDAFGSVTISPATYTASQFFIQLTPQGIASTSLYQNTDLYLTTSFQWGGGDASNTVVIGIAYYLI
jgi:hypothetical protein